MLRRAGTVLFDCDSTLCSIEGIEALAEGHRDEIAQLTAAAMDGLVPLEDVYARRLELVRPSRQRVQALAEAYVAALVPDARDTVAALAAEGVRVGIMSAGLSPAVTGVARELGIAHSDVAAVDVHFDAEGRYAGFDVLSALTRSGGKARLLTAWRAALPTPIVLVGDGVTDLEARDVADFFVAFAGVVERDAVVAGADLVVRARSLAPVLPIALAGEAPRAANARIFEKGMALLDDGVRQFLHHRSTAEP